MQIKTATGDLIDVVVIQGGSSSSAQTEINYSTRLIKDAVTGVTIAETRTLGTVTEKQNWIYDGSGAYIGVDAWVTV